MKRILMLLSISLIFVANIAEAQAYRETDRFTGETMIYSTKRRSGLGWRKRVLYFYIIVPTEGLQIQEKGFENLSIHGCFEEENLNWQYLNYHDFMFLADGELIKSATRTSQSGGVHNDGRVWETVRFSIRGTDFLKLLNAKMVEYRVGGYEFKLKPKVLEEMRSFRDEILKDNYCEAPGSGCPNPSYYTNGDSPQK